MSGSLFDAISAARASDPQRPALILADGAVWSWRELDRRSAAIAGVLVERGIRPADRVAAQVEKSPQALALYLACLRVGAVFLPLNPAYRASELTHMLGDATPRLVVVDPERRDLVAELVAPGTSILTLDGAGAGELTAAASTAAPLTEPVQRGSADLAALLYTSGTTGKPKGAMLSHGNLTSNARVLVRAWGFTDDDVLLHALPIFHVHGLFVACHCALLSGASMLWFQRFDAAEVEAALASATVMMGVPTFYTRLLDRPGFGRDQASKVRLFISGSAPLLAETHRAFEQRTGMRILERYGMTEILMHCSNPLHGERRPGSVGPVLPGSELRILDDADRDVPTGTTGQVAVRGPNVFAGYWNLLEKTKAEFTADGWFRTGDLGTLSADGYLTLVGRAKDLIITGGLNVYPIEVEEVIDALPGVAETAVIGLPDADFGEAVTAVVTGRKGVPLPSAEEVIAAAKARLAGFKVPKRVVFVDELPRNAMGKVQKALLRRQLGG